MTQIEGSILAHVWNIVDEHNAGCFNKQMFSIALHILQKVKKNIDPPRQIPHETRTCATAYFATGKLEISAFTGGAPAQ
jgi:hypothetical protein